MEKENTRVAMVGIIVEDESSTAQLNALLHEAGAYIIGRMGIPYAKKGIRIISVAMDAPQDLVNTLSDKLSALPGVSTRTTWAHEAE